MNITICENKAKKLKLEPKPVDKDGYPIKR